jgi:aminodeoxyfutalosine synthase
MKERGLEKGSIKTAPIPIKTGARRRLRDRRLLTVAEKISKGERLDAEAALACLDTNDLSGLGCLAHAVRVNLYGNRAFYVLNLHLNYTNICQNRCAFCAFYRDMDAPDAYIVSAEEAARRVREYPLEGLSEVHVVGGCHPDLPFDYYTSLISAIRSARPGIGIKAFTAVEVSHMAERSGMSVTRCLEGLKEAGLSAMPGGGAEIFSQRLHRELFPSKIEGRRWLEIHGEAHRMGIRSNATMLFGHREGLDEIVAHLMLLREQQDRTGGFQAFIPLPFHPGNTALSSLPGPTGVEILKIIATSRLVLDNIPHIKAYWVMLGLKLTQTALFFGADDLEGTIGKENIAHQAGADTAAGLSMDELNAMIKEAGFLPALRNTHHQVLSDCGEAL